MIACRTGAQNIDASEKMADRPVMVKAAESSLRTKIDSISYSNSGLIVLPWASF